MEQLKVAEMVVQLAEMKVAMMAVKMVLQMALTLVVMTAGKMVDSTVDEMDLMRVVMLVA
jgi:hypothetical protein